MFLVIFVVSITHWYVLVKECRERNFVFMHYGVGAVGGSNGQKSILANLLLKCQEWSNICTRVRFV